MGAIAHAWRVNKTAELRSITEPFFIATRFLILVIDSMSATFLAVNLMSAGSSGIVVDESEQAFYPT